MWQFGRSPRRCATAPDRATYMDPAITPQCNEEFEDLELYHATTGGESALARKRRDETIRKAKAAVTA